MRDSDELTRRLRGCSLFSDASSEALTSLKDIVVTDVLKPGDRVVRLPENVATICFISEGLIKLTYWDVEGRNATLQLLGPEDVWVSLKGLTLAYGIELCALKTTVLLRTTQQQIGCLLMRHPELGPRLFDFALRRTGRLQERLAEVMTKTVRKRLATLLLQLDTELGVQHREGHHVLNLSITHDDLAAYRAEWRPPVAFEYRGHTVYSMAPASSGGIILALIMNILKNANPMPPFGSAELIHL